MNLGAIAMGFGFPGFRRKAEKTPGIAGDLGIWQTLARDLLL
jgi:hypothetical protein